MKLRNMGVFVLLCSLLVARYPSDAKNTSKATEDSCRRSAQGFYDWYTPKVLAGGTDWHIALDQKGQEFGKNLTQALKNSDIESKADGDPVLDFDPILNSQDPGDHYTVRTVTINHDRCFADVYGVWSRPVPNNGQTLNVVAELTYRNGGWVFVNFHYPRGGNLPSIDLLKILGFHYKGQPTETK